MNNNSLSRAVELANGQSGLARKINQWFASRGIKKNLKQQHVYKWLNHSSGVPTAPAEYRLAIAEITGHQVTAESLSHDVYEIKYPVCIEDKNCGNKIVENQ